MRKAFDANVTRAKPHLRLGASVLTLDPPTDEFPAPAINVDHGGHPAPQASLPAPTHASVVQAEEAIAQTAAAQELPVAGTPIAQRIVDRLVQADADSIREDVQAHVEHVPDEIKTATVPPAPALDPSERRERLRERLKAATAKVEPSQPTPQTPAEARVSALALVGQLRQELEDSRKLTGSLSHDLEQARAELARSAEEARSRTQEASRMAGEVGERAKLIEELGKEMASLEAERDDALVELRAARGEMEKLREARDELDARLATRDAELSDALTEEERLAGDLEARAQDLRRSDATLAALTEERDRLAKQVGDLTRERADLLDSQKALDEIHRALAEARSRVGAARPGS